MIVCVQYFYYRAPIYGKTRKNEITFLKPFKTIKPFVAGAGVYEPIAVWKIKHK